MPCPHCLNGYIPTASGPFTVLDPCRACDDGYILDTGEPEPTSDGWLDCMERDGNPAPPDLRLDGGNLYPYTWPDLRYIAANDDRFFADIA
jgi:hypothetical protein